MTTAPFSFCSYDSCCSSRNVSWSQSFTNARERTHHADRALVLGDFGPAVLSFDALDGGLEKLLLDELDKARTDFRPRPLGVFLDRLLDLLLLGDRLLS